MRNRDEVVLSSEENEIEMESKGGAAHGLSKWGRFLPKMILRVLLVEGDDSTRQIISALLRKCNYKVVAVPDGLKAWEILKGRPENIDIILTEVDLPSISGYPLLTLIAEHKMCKNIPVIMMSSHDSIGTVYKCMLGGASDYLVKPIRINELRNLWQHVWRRQSSIVGGNVPQDESVGQQKLEMTSENNAVSNESSGFRACIKRNKEQIEKGTDAQSSCTRLDLDYENRDVEIINEFPCPKRRKERLDFSHQLLIHESQAKETGASEVVVNEDVDSERQGMEGDIDEACKSHASNSRQAIDFMGTFRSHNFSSDNDTMKFYAPELLDLSLKRSHSSAFGENSSDERPLIQHSGPSAFSRYDNKTIQTQFSTSLKTSCDKNLSETVANYNFNAPGPPNIRITSLAVGQSEIQPKPSKPTNLGTHQSTFPNPPPVQGISVNNLNTSYGSCIPKTFSTQTNLSPTQSRSSASQQQELNSRGNPFQQSIYENNKFEQFYDQLVQNTNAAKQDHNFTSNEDRRHISTTTDQSGSGSGSFSNHLNNMGYGSTCGSNSNVDQVNIVNEDGLLTLSGNSHRSIRREVALTKFRMKRKDRCFEKKVRYESRKKLAEQRPRVKGQFVRKVQTENQSGSSSL